MCRPSSARPVRSIHARSMRSDASAVGLPPYRPEPKPPISIYPYFSGALHRRIFLNHQVSSPSHGVCPSLPVFRCVLIAVFPSRFSGRSTGRHAACSARNDTGRAACTVSPPASAPRRSCPGIRPGSPRHDRTIAARARGDGPHPCRSRSIAGRVRRARSTGKRITTACPTGGAAIGNGGALAIQ